MNSKARKIYSQSIVAAMLMALLSGTMPSVLAAPGDTTVVSVDPSGTPGNGPSSRGFISPDGRFVILESDATNLVAGGTGGMYIRDLQIGQTTRVPIDGEDAVVSRGGRFVAYTAWVIGETADDSMSDVYVYDRQTPTTITKVSVDPSGGQGNGWSDSPVISDDGRFIAFHSAASNLVAGDANAAGDIFVRDMHTGTTERVSVATGGTEANGASSDPSISADGLIVVFSSNATNLVSGDTNGSGDIFVRDRQNNGVTTMASVTTTGVEADHGASDASTAGDGRFISFSSFSENLLPPDQDPLGFEHVYVHDRQSGSTTLVTVGADGFQFIARSEQSVISADGRFVAFQFDDRGDGQAIFVVDLIDRQTGTLTTLSAPHAPGGDISGDPSMSADGRLVTFTSPKAIISADTNGVNDVYMHETSIGTNPIPNVNSVQAPSSTFPTPASVAFTVNFTENVTGVGIEDFALTMGGGVTGATVTGVSGSGSQYMVTVNTGTGDGFLRLDVLDDDSIVDASLNPLGGTGAGNGNFTTGQLFEVDKSTPVATGILRADPDPTAADHVHFTVTFSEPVSGVDPADFTVSTIGSISGAAVEEVSGSGATYALTVNTGSGDGGLHPDLIDNDSIIDAVGIPLGGVGAGNGTFNSGEAYTIEKNPPVVISSLRADSNPTAAATVRFRVTFSEAVRGVDAGDFSVTTSGGVSGAALTEISRADNIYTITVSTGTGDGTIRLDVIDDDSIMDAADHPLGGLGAGNANFLTGEVYTITKTQISRFSESFRSNGTNDGWVLESSEDSNMGGSRNASAITFNLGDDSQDRQYRSILHFPTYYLPDNAVVTQVILMIKNQGVVGTNPFTTHQNINIDIRGGYFGSAGLFGLNALDLTDFQAPADLNSVGTIVNNPVSGWYWALLNPSANAVINLQGVTQLRLNFQLDDNDDSGDDYLTFFSGNYDLLLDRPHLLIEYFTQR